MIDRILICGCARSGNTLMFSLIDTGFENIVKVKGGPWGEQVPKEVVEGKVVVGKFPRKASRLHKLMADDLGIIYMMRDPRDVLVSKHFERPEHIGLLSKDGSELQLLLLNIKITLTYCCSNTKT